MLTEGYQDVDEVDLRGHAASLAAYGVLVASALVAGRLGGRSLPGRIPLVDVLVGGVATHKLSRLLAKGSVTSPLRAPFTEFDGPAGAAEHQEHAREGSAGRHTIGELITCPFCLAVWLGTAYVGGLSVAPSATRAVATVFSVVTISDWLQLGYERARRDVV